MMCVLTPGGSYLLEVSSCLVPPVLLVTTNQIRLILEQHRCEPHGSTDTQMFFSKYVTRPQMQNLGYRELTVKLFKELGSEVWFPQPPCCSGITMIPDVPSSTCGHSDSEGHSQRLIRVLSAKHFSQLFPLTLLVSSLKLLSVSLSNHPACNRT